MNASNFKIITIGERGVILENRDKESKEISVSDIKNIFIKVKKVSTKYIVLFLGLSLSAVLFTVWIYGFNLVAISPSLLIFAAVIKLNSYKRYVLKIKLKSGDSLIHPIPLKSRHKTIQDIKKVRKVLDRNCLSH